MEGASAKVQWSFNVNTVTLLLYMYTERIYLFIYFTHDHIIITSGSRRQDNFSSFTLTISKQTEEVHIT